MTGQCHDIIEAYGNNACPALKAVERICFRSLYVLRILLTTATAADNRHIVMRSERR
jgi:hypothetical protein